MERIKENREDRYSRYLLLISNSSYSCYLLSSILEDNNYHFFIGSQFKEDVLSEEYQLKVINKIKIYMEQGGTIILKDLDTVYPALYDLFNQNFTIMCNKNFTRISVGSRLNAYPYVHENFKIIVFVNEENIDNQEPPFLNRFEKHIANYENLLSENQILMSYKI